MAHNLASVRPLGPLAPPVLFFIVFLLSRKLAERLWLLLVLYTEAILLAQFIWQFPFADGVANDNFFAVIFGTAESNQEIRLDGISPLHALWLLKT